MKTDPKGFLIAGKGSRTFVAVRAPELRALEVSDNPSLRALARRVREAVEKADAYRDAQIARSEKISRLNEERQAAIDADPKLKAEQEARRLEFARMLGIAP